MGATQDGVPVATRRDAHLDRDAADLFLLGLVCKPALQDIQSAGIAMAVRAASAQQIRDGLAEPTQGHLLLSCSRKRCVERQHKLNGKWCLPVPEPVSLSPSGAELVSCGRQEVRNVAASKLESASYSQRVV